jgi:hypothetical protein
MPGTEQVSGRFFYMTHSNKNKYLKPISLTVVAALLVTPASAVGAGQETKTALTTTSVDAASLDDVIVSENRIPDRPVVILDVNVEEAATATDDIPDIETTEDYSEERDLSRFDLVEDDPLFIGAPGVSEFDTLEAQRQKAYFPRTLNVNPFFTVAGAGILTPF